MRVVLVSGIVNKHFIEAFSSQKDIIFTNTFTHITDLSEEIYNTGITFLNAVDSIVVTDYAFDKRETRERVEDFIELQDILQTSGLRDTKLYLITRNSDMYTQLERNEGGAPGILYINTEVMLISGEYKTKILTDIVRGERDRFGLYHPDVDNQDFHSRLERDRDDFIESSRAVDKHILNYGTDEPISVLSSSDFIDSKYSEKKLMEQRKERRRRQQEMERQSKRSKKNSKRGYEEEEEEIDYEEDYGGININSGSSGGRSRGRDRSFKFVEDDIPKDMGVPRQNTRPPKRYTSSEDFDVATEYDDLGVESLVKNIDNRQVYTSEEGTGIGEDLSTDASQWKSVRNIQKLKEVAEQKRGSGLIVTDKVKNDSGIIGVFGDRQSGTSGFVANLAEVYGTSGREVLVIDLDLLNRQQTAYFPKYEAFSRGYKGIANGLMKAVQGGSVSRTSVDITSRINVLGMSRQEPYDEENYKELYVGLEDLLNEAVVEYDIVILDIPFDKTFEFLNVLSEIVNSFVMVTSDLIYRNDIYFTQYLGNMVKENINIMNTVFKKTKVVVSKINANHILSNGERHSNKIFHDWLLSLQYPFDRLYMLGEIPYYNDWESQYNLGIRYVWQNETLMYMYADILNNIILD